MKGFKNQITVKVLLSKYKGNGGKEFAPVYFNSSTKTVINFEYNIDKYFKGILYKIDNWINEGSGWIVEYRTIGLNMSISLFIVHFQEVHTLNCLIN